MCLHYKWQNASFLDLNKIAKRATPNKIAKYKLALQLHRAFNQMSPENEWMHLNCNQILTSRLTKFYKSQLSQTLKTDTPLGYMT